MTSMKRKLTINTPLTYLRRHPRYIRYLSALVICPFFISCAFATNTQIDIKQPQNENPIAQDHNGSVSEKAEDPQEKAFQQWIISFKTLALAQGIDEALFDQAFQGVKLDHSVFKQAKFQPEFTIKPEQYLDNHVTKTKIHKGAVLAKEWQDSLKQIENQFHVAAPYLLAIWSMESNYGAIFKGRHKLKDAISALASLAFGDPKRKKYATTQLIAALRILQKGEIDRQNLLGSWAGALGQTQFIPTSYLQYGVDMDNDGKIDIWHSVPDALATAANLLAKNGWVKDESWGFEIAPPHKKFSSNETRTLKEWHNSHIYKINGDRIPATDQKATLKLFKGDKTMAFLVLKNFSVIKAYNKSDLYALSVGLLADAIAKEGQHQRLEKDAAPAQTAPAEEKKS